MEEKPTGGGRLSLGLGVTATREGRDGEPEQCTSRQRSGVGVKCRRPDATAATAAEAGGAGESQATIAGGLELEDESR